jgi:hypothetical protein
MPNNVTRFKRKEKNTDSKAIINGQMNMISNGALPCY